MPKLPPPHIIIPPPPPHPHVQHNKTPPIPLSATLNPTQHLPITKTTNPNQPHNQYLHLCYVYLLWEIDADWEIGVTYGELLVSTDLVFWVWEYVSVEFVVAASGGL